MFIAKFSVEDWVGNQNRGCVKQAQSWQEIDAAIKELDGHRKTLVTLETEGETGACQGKHVEHSCRLGRAIAKPNKHSRVGFRSKGPTNKVDMLSGETHMAVGGGTGKYVVYVTFDNESFYHLIDPSKSNKDETVIVGGQEGIYSAKSCVELNTTLKAAKTFAELGTMEKSVIWEKDGVVERV